LELVELKSKTRALVRFARLVRNISGKTLHLSGAAIADRPIDWLARSGRRPATASRTDAVRMVG
jgi:hypothetical protein